jgi:hypothetical protein
MADSLDRELTKWLSRGPHLRAPQQQAPGKLTSKDELICEALTQATAVAHLTVDALAKVLAGGGCNRATLDAASELLADLKDLERALRPYQSVVDAWLKHSAQFADIELLALESYEAAIDEIEAAKLTLRLADQK